MVFISLLAHSAVENLYFVWDGSSKIFGEQTNYIGLLGTERKYTGFEVRKGIFYLD